MKQAGHRVVHEEGRVGDLALPFTFRWDVLRVGEDAFPFATWHNLRQLLLNEGASLFLKGLILRNINDESHLFFVNTMVVMHLSLVSNGL